MNRLAGAELVVALNSSFPVLMPLESRYDTEIQIPKNRLHDLMNPLTTRFGFH